MRVGGCDQCRPGWFRTIAPIPVLLHTAKLLERMARVSTKDRALRAAPPGLAVTDAAARPADAVLADLRSSAQGLTSQEAAVRLRTGGPNAVRAHHARPWSVLARQSEARC